ncbi:unnamed protein product [Onchocerca flexuosa]|uniref:Lipoprotein n=1 Tax=Onchocerca flexuosa TaxID=387005 RepID=A0A183HT12_9BILA|nr:unnamed protein product [Onchocerca flexuosa]
MYDESLARIQKPTQETEQEQPIAYESELLANSEFKQKQGDNIACLSDGGDNITCLSGNNGKTIYLPDNSGDITYLSDSNDNIICLSVPSKTVNKLKVSTE